MRKILCPRHKEDTPSCVVYSDGHAFCFGCGAYLRAEDIGLTRADIPLPEEPEDPTPMLEYIRSLPTKAVRGLELPADEYAYYLLYPGEAYYKRRPFEGKSRYIGPRGIKTPLFVAQRVPGSPCVVIEGEINALSVAKACPELTVISPGSASQLTVKTCPRILTFASKSASVLIVADNDPPGAKGVINLLGELKSQVSNLSWHLMSPDANDILTGSGADVLRCEILRAVEKGLAESA